MPAKKNTKTRVKLNLIPKSDFETSYTGRIVAWLLGTFRLIVIIVEIIVIAGFGARFWLDMAHARLNDEIKRKKALIEGYHEFESEYQRILAKIDIYQSASSPNYHFSPTLTTVIKSLPPDIKLDSLKIEQNTITIVGQTLVSNSIAQFMVNLKQDSKFETIQLQSISSIEDSIYLSFTIKTIDPSPKEKQ